MTLVTYKKTYIGDISKVIVMNIVKEQIEEIEKRKKSQLRKTLFSTLSKPQRENWEKSKQRKVWFG